MGASTDFERARGTRLELETRDPAHRAARVVPTSRGEVIARDMSRASVRVVRGADGARDRVAASTGASTSARAGTTRGRESRRRVVVFRRGAYTNLPEDERPPFHASWEVPCGLLGARRAARSRADPNLPLTSTSSTTRVDVEVDPCGANGFFLDVVITGHIDVVCACCGEVYAHALDDDEEEEESNFGFLAWLDPNADVVTSSGDHEVFPFPRSVEELDLTPIIADTIDFGLPSELSCAPCRVDEPESWSCDPA